MKKPILNLKKSLFTEELINGETINISSEGKAKNIPLAVWKMMLTKRDLYLYSKGLKINRHWKISDVKTYFGIKGRGIDKVLAQFMEIHNEVTTKMKI
tara:strand:- start:783 stop:1076 length:294 start_codon:yes stop_codon:yes gene_type:complete